jgi:hypothetical protein
MNKKAAVSVDERIETRSQSKVGCRADEGHIPGDKGMESEIIFDGTYEDEEVAESTSFI